jgi:hypothetical protein
MKLLPLGLGEAAELRIKAMRGFDMAAGKGMALQRKVTGGTVGLILDFRGRPFRLPEDDGERLAKLKEWMTGLEVYPSEALERLGR